MTMVEKIPIRGLAKDITYSTASTGIVIYERTSGRKLYITKIVATNQESTDNTLDLYDGNPTNGRKLLRVIVPGGQTKEVDKLGDSVYCEYGDLEGRVSTTGTVTVTPIGYEQ